MALVAVSIAAWVGGAVAASFGVLFVVGYGGDRRVLLTVGLLVGGLVLATSLFMIRLTRVFSASASLRGEEDAALPTLRRRVQAAERLAIAGELAARVAHEIKNPLAPIKGYAQMLQAKLDSVAPSDRALFEKGLAIIRNEVDAIDGRIRALLKMARPSADASDAADPSTPSDPSDPSGRSTLSDPAPARRPTLDIHRVLRESIALIEGLPVAPKMVTSFARDLPAVVGDADEIRGALVNVLTNAIDATVEAGADPRARVELVSAFEERGRFLDGPVVAIEVKDEGVGVADLDQDRLFRTFYTTKPKGTGLGLAIARTAIEAAGGAIELGARADRRGAVVRIELQPALSALGLS
ncbi:MAG: hypothetical protein H6729_02310 [Deltaproteobacteria bacterium]|nr:hypothetical protein [Deltaproteobacteria bacterium]